MNIITAERVHVLYSRAACHCSRTLYIWTDLCLVVLLICFI